MCIYNLKNIIKFKLLAFWNKQTPSLTKNVPIENVPKNLEKIQKKAFFLRKTSLYDPYSLQGKPCCTNLVVFLTFFQREGGDQVKAMLKNVLFCKGLLA